MLPSYRNQSTDLHYNGLVGNFAIYRNDLIWIAVWFSFQCQNSTEFRGVSSLKIFVLSANLNRYGLFAPGVSFANLNHQRLLDTFLAISMLNVEQKCDVVLN